MYYQHLCILSSTLSIYVFFMILAISNECDSLYSFQNLVIPYLMEASQRSYHVENNGSRPINAVKQH